ncbi:acyltransferase family protein [Paludibaculum fermentans]|uniref:acyltransferase family protein n=1 Tax=Paludibaculum fermentans TaxID=1473598 RepID=UPI003EC00590
MATGKHIPALDGLRFFAAFFVLIAHYTHWVLNDQKIANSLTNGISTMAGLGMALFFVLSGFVIHYNYHSICDAPGGRKQFLWARFARLYPLYFVLFIAEFASSFYYHRGSCGHAGVRMGFFFALPFYLTFTQAWFYSVICQNNLIYQYHMVSSVIWSLSVEAFFYLTYLLIVRWLCSQSSLFKQISIAGFGYLVGVGLLLWFDHYSSAIDRVAEVAFGPIATVQHNYQDSLLRWLNYFNPLINLPAFVCGAVAANIHLSLKDKAPTRVEKAISGYVVTGCVVATLAAHLSVYLMIAPHNPFFGRNGSLLYVPMVTVLVYVLSHYPQALCSRAIGSKLTVKLGEASYSIYLLHAFLGWNARDYYYLNLNPWLLYITAVISILVISRISFLCFERPVQRWLRNLAQHVPSGKANIVGTP